MLAEHGYIREKSAECEPKAGRPPSETYEVNPAIQKDSA